MRYCCAHLLTNVLTLFLLTTCCWSQQTSHFSDNDMYTLEQRGCSVYIFNFEKEFPDLGLRLAPNATSRTCTLEGLVNMGGPLFKRGVITSDLLATMHTSRGLAPAKFGQHAGPWWFAEALKSSHNIVTDIDAADVIYVDDYCYAAWVEGKAHHQGLWGPGEELYVDPDVYLRHAYEALTQHPAFTKNDGASFVYFHSHPALTYIGILCSPAFNQGLHFVTEGNARRTCKLPEGSWEGRMMVVPYSTFPVYQHPRAPDQDRTNLIYLRAGCVGETLGKKMRRAIVDAFAGVPEAIVSCNAGEWEDSVHRELSNSKFCLIPPGDSPSSRRLTEAVLMGCVPVFVGPPFAALPMLHVVPYDKMALAFTVQNTSEWLPEDAGGAFASLSAFVPSMTVVNLLDIVPVLAGISDIHYAKLRHQVARAAPFFSYAPLSRGMSSPGMAVSSVGDALYARMCFHAGKRANNPFTMSQGEQQQQQLPRLLRRHRRRLLRRP